MAKQKSKKGSDKKTTSSPLRKVISVLNSPVEIPNKILLPILGFIVLLTVLISSYQVIFADKFFIGTFVGDTNISYLTEAQAYRILSDKYSRRLDQRVQFRLNSSPVEIDLATASAEIEVNSALKDSYNLGRTGTIAEKLFTQLKLLVSPSVTKPQANFKIDPQLKQIKQSVFKAPVDAKLSIEEKEATSTPEIKITEGQNGSGLDEQKLKLELTNFIAFGKYDSTLPIKTVAPSITSENAKMAKKYLESLTQQEITLSFEDQTWKIDTKALVNLLDLSSTESTLIDQEKLNAYLEEVAEDIDRPVREGQFEFNPETKRVTQFSPSEDGRKLNLEKTTTLITQALDNKSSRQINLPVEVTKSKVKLGQVNDLGINELLGRGVSNFAGSIPNRAFNLTLAASRINGVLVPPGETFSFNGTVGDITAATGFKQAYVIKSGRTVLDDGGGVCQASTTIFRAALNAGLPITDRTAHAYRVGYYEQGSPPGLDATTYYPTVDFKFKNDTPSHILIQAYASGTYLYVDLYGTADGRITDMTKPVILSQTPPLPEIRQDDPELPRGTVKQVDWAAWGAKVTFKRTVTRNGQTLLEENWNSNYRPWQAVYLVGTKDG